MKKLGFGMIVLILWVVLICMPAQTLALSTSAPARESAAAFYKGKVVEYVVSYAPGGNIDAFARLLAPFLGKHLGATVIVRNEPGGGGKVALNRLAKEKNGLSILSTSPRGPILSQIYGEPGVRYDLAKFNWLGALNRNEYLIVVSKKSGYKSITDLQHAKEVKFAAATKTEAKAIRPLLMGLILDINVKAVTGYKGSSDEIMAVLRGEVDGVSHGLVDILPYIHSQDVLPLLTFTRNRLKLFPNIPTIFEVKKLSALMEGVLDVNLSLDQIGRPVATTPGVPRERVSFLESALKKTVEDPELREKLEKFLGEPIIYLSPKETTELINAPQLTLQGETKAFLGKFIGAEGY